MSEMPPPPMNDPIPPPDAELDRRGSLQDWERAIAGPASGARGKRPLAITVAGALLVVAGGFAALAAGLIVVSGDAARVQGLGDASATATAVAVALALCEVGAGVLVLRRVQVGRVVGIVVSVLGILAGLATIGSASGLVTVAIFGFVVVALATNGGAFGVTSEGNPSGGPG